MTANAQGIMGNSLTSMPICRKNESAILQNNRVFHFELSQYHVFYLILSYIRVFDLVLSCFRLRIIVLSCFRPRIIVLSPSHYRTILRDSLWPLKATIQTRGAFESANILNSVYCKRKRSSWTVCSLQTVTWYWDFCREFRYRYMALSERTIFQ